MSVQMPAIMANTAWVQGALQKLPVFVSLALIVACAHVLVKITWLLLPQPEMQTVSSPVTTAPVRTADDQQAFRKLAAAHLFGQVAKQAPVATAEVPETRLNLVLRGVLATMPMEMASVIISQGKGGKEDIYGIGDKLPGNISIEEIHAEYVILNRNGRLETLRLAKDEDVGEISSAQEGEENLPPATPGEALKQIRSEILRNPTSFADYAMPVIVKENGQQIGYRLQPQQKGELLSQVGLQPDDIITEINGVSLDKPANGISALRTLTNASMISLKVKRGGAIVPLSVQLQ